MHKKIKSFFAQFKKGSAFHKIRAELQKKEWQAGTLDSEPMDMNMSSAGAAMADFSPLQKALNMASFLTTQCLI